MNNLLRTLTESHVKSSPDLKLLLNNVKDVRRQGYENKASDTFYESLEDLLLDLRTVTMDNHDAEAFLKPVAKSDAPDYYDVISNPMDLQTMLKKAKAKQYKSKREFKDDLDLIWSNCYTYNATEDHPLRLCAKRLKKKADRLLMNLTDRKDRVDPPIPFDLSQPVHTRRPKINGFGSHERIRPKQRSPGFAYSNSAPTNIGRQASASGAVSREGSTLGKPSTPKDTPFPDTPALVRTSQGMAMFRELERDLDYELGFGEPGPSTLANGHVSLKYKLRRYAYPDYAYDSESEDETIKVEDTAVGTTSEMGEKTGSIQPTVHSHRPRKRARLTPPDSDSDTGSRSYTDPHRVSERDRELTTLWWQAVQNDALVANGLPCLPSIASFPPRSRSTPPHATQPDSLPSTRKRPKPKVNTKHKQEPAAASAPPNTLLYFMNANIKTLKRVRRTHAKYAALNLNAEEGTGQLDEPPGDAAAEEAIAVDEAVDERPWRIRLPAKTRRRGGGERGMGGVREGAKVETDAGGNLGGTGMETGKMGVDVETDEPTGIELGAERACDCLRWMNGRVLEHAGFQGASSGALDVLASVTSEYLLNVGRSLRYLCDKYARSMTPEEIILHTLFESGITKVQDLERYIKDDVIRYGARLVDLEKKLVGAYRDATSVEVLDDDALFGPSTNAINGGSEDEEDSTFAMGLGGFSEAFGEDFLGLKELGIAAEFGLTSLSIPKRLLRGRKGAGGAGGAATAKPTEPPPPYPPPPPFVPITSRNVEGQIGLLKPYYQERLAALAPPGLLPPPSTAHPTLLIPGIPPLPGFGVPPPGSGQTTPGAPGTPPLLTLPDDSGPPAQTKLGPIGQVMKTGPAAGAMKKKNKAPKDGPVPLPPALLQLKPEDAMVDGASAFGFGSAAPADGVQGAKKKNGIGGTGNGKTGSKSVDLPPVIAASA
ncbi:hypothetical protein F5I97DRAFT_1904452 [Phlebopus sp. FC_14]|nr:hypothetical protein F5I97DRAFT_1904452 [Phlebopus sp. FC_14]